MRVEIRDNSGKLIWAAYRDAEETIGIKSAACREDGILVHVLRALENARQQVVSELSQPAEMRCDDLGLVVDRLIRGFTGQWVRRREVQQ